MAQSSRRQVNYGGSTSNALEKMRSLSKEIKDQTRRGLNSSLLVQQQDSNSKGTIEFNASAYQNKGVYSESQILQNSSETTSAINSKRLPPTNNLDIQQKNIGKKFINDVKEYKIQNQSELPETFRGDEIGQTANKLQNSGNNLTASFNQEDLEKLNSKEKNNNLEQSSDNKYQKQVFEKYITKGKLNLDELVDFPKYQGLIRNDLDESNIDEGYDDIQRNVNQKTDRYDQINLTDLTYSHNNDAVEDRNFNDKSLCLQQLEHSQWDDKLSKSIYKTTNMMNQKSQIIQNYGEVSKNSLDQQNQVQELLQQLNKYKKVVEQQQQKIQDEQVKREQIEEDFNVSQTNYEQQILSKIQTLLAAKEPNLEELMNLSLKQEKEKQQLRNQQVLVILKQKDKEIRQGAEQIEVASQQIDLLEQELKDMQNQNLFLQQNNSNLQEQIKKIIVDQDKLSIKQQNYFKQQNVQKDLKIKELENFIQNYESQVQKVHSDLTAREEQKILQQGIDRIEIEKQELQVQNKEIQNNYEKQIEMLKKQLNKNFIEIERLTLIEQNFYMQSHIVKSNRSCQTDLAIKDIQRIENLIQQTSKDTNFQLNQNDFNELKEASISLDEKYFKNTSQVKENSNIEIFDMVLSIKPTQNTSKDGANFKDEYIKCSEKILKLENKLCQLESLNKNKEIQIEKLMKELNQSQDQVKQISKINFDNYDGMTHEDLQKFCEFLKKENTKLQIQLVDIKDVEYQDKIYFENYIGKEKEQLIGHTQKISQINNAIIDDEMVFNPYKTNQAPNILQNYTVNDISDTMINNKDIIKMKLFQNNPSIQSIMQENFQLKQQLIFQGKYSIDLIKKTEQFDNNHQEMQSQIVQLKEYIQKQEIWFKDEVDKLFSKFNTQIMLKFEQKESEQNHFNLPSNIDNQNLEKELKVAINKLCLQYNFMIEKLNSNSNDKNSENIEFINNETISHQQNAIKLASNTILQLKQNIFFLERNLATNKLFQNTIIENKILTNRQQFLVVQINYLNNQIQNRNTLFIQEKVQIVELYEQIIKDFNNKDKLLQDSYFQKSEQENKILALIEQNKEYEQKIKRMDEDIIYFKESVIKQAELEYDKRQKLRDQNIKDYFNQNVIKYISNPSSVNQQSAQSQFNLEQDTLQLTQQFCQMQLVIDQLKRENDVLIETKLANEAKNQELIQNIKQNLNHIQSLNQQLLYPQANQQKTIIQSLKNHQELVINLKNEIQNFQNIIEKKNIQLMELEKNINQAQFNQVYQRFDYFLDNIEQNLLSQNQESCKFSFKTQKNQKFVANDEYRSHIETLQRQLVQQREQQILEIEEIKTNCEIELMEGKRIFQQQQDTIYQKKKNNSEDSYNLFQLLDEQKRLKERNEELYKEIESIRFEVIQAERQIEKERQKFQIQQQDISVYQEAIKDLEYELLKPLLQKREEDANKDEQQNECQEKLEQFRIHQTNFRGNHINSEYQSKDTTQSNSQRNFEGQLKTKLGYQIKNGIIKNKNKNNCLQQMQTKNVRSISNDNHILNQAINSDRSQMSYISAHEGNNNQQLFIKNPPLIIQKLIQYKLHEKYLLQQVEKYKQNELNARAETRKILMDKVCQSKGLQSQELFQRQIAEERLIRHDLETKIQELEINNYDNFQKRFLFLDQDINDTKFNFKKDSVNIQNLRNNQVNQNNDYCLMVNSLLYLINNYDIRKQESNYQDQDIQYSQQLDSVYKIIIFQLYNKLQKYQNNNEQPVIDKYVPQGEKNMKIWYLELLESQVSMAEVVINKLIDFVKRLQIDIQGSLSSAALVKATSMNLAQNSKEASEEIKLLKHITLLIRSDMDSISQTKGHLSDRDDKNPFLDGTINRQQQYPIENFSNMIDLQNQLTIVSKVKNSVEKELLNLKQILISSKKEFSQQLNQYYKQVQDLQNQIQKDEAEQYKLSQDNECLQKQLQALQDQHRNITNQAINQIDQKERENSAVVKNQSITSKNLQRLQNEMHEWRKTTDENLKIKDSKITDLQQKYKVSEKEVQKLKAENQMLRKNQKEWLGSTSKQFEEQRNDLQEQLNSFEKKKHDEHKKLIQDNQQLLQQIEILENNDNNKGLKGQGIIANSFEVEENKQQIKPITTENTDELFDKNQKLKKKIIQKDQIIKQFEIQQNQLKSEVLKSENIKKEIQQQLDISEKIQRDIKIELLTSQEQLRQYKIEKEIIQAEKIKYIESQDADSQNIYSQLEILKDEIIEIKMEKEMLQHKINKTKDEEIEGRESVEELKKNINQMRIRIQIEQEELEQRMNDLTIKDESLTIQLKMVQNENNLLKQDKSKLQQQILQNQNQLDEKNIINSQLQAQIKNQNRIANDQQYQISVLTQKEQILQSMLKQNECFKNRTYQELSSKIEEIKESRESLGILYENQLDLIKQKVNDQQTQISVLKDPKHGGLQKEKILQDTELMFQLTQKESVIKQLKKEISNNKQSLQKYKIQMDQFKIKIASMQKTIDTNHQNKNNPTSILKKNQSKENINVTNNNNNNQEQEEFEYLLEKVQELNDIQEKSVESQCYAAKTQGWNIVLTKQTEEQEFIISQLRAELDELIQKDCKDQKLQKILNNQTENIKKLQNELRAIDIELSQVKSTWIPPESQKKDCVKELQSQVRQLKEEINRKKDIIQNQKRQKDCCDKELQDQSLELQILKEDNAKLQKQASVQNQTQINLKIMKQDNECLKQSQTQLIQEAQQLQDKIKSLKSDLQRKDLIIKENKQMNFEKNQKNTKHTDEETQHSKKYISDGMTSDHMQDEQKRKLKEMKEKYKLDIDIKENQVKSLKLKIDQLEQIISELRDERAKFDEINIPQQLQQLSVLQKQCKKDSTKLKRYDNLLKKALSALNQISQYQTNFSKDDPTSEGVFQDKGKKQKIEKNVNQDVEDYQQIYNESAQILGVSLDEFDLFVNPVQISKGQFQSVQNIFDKFKKYQSVQQYILESKSKYNEQQIAQEIEQVLQYFKKLFSKK